MTIKKSDALITSVTLKDPLDDTTYPLVKTSETTLNETWSITFNPVKSGNHDCTLEVMNTRNEVSKAGANFKVIGGEEIELTPGFELLLSLITFAIIPARKRLRKR